MSRSPLPSVGRHVDHEKIELSAAQSEPRLASPEDFEINENLPPAHGQCGDTMSEYNRLVKQGRKGNKFATTPRDEHGRTLRP